MASQEKNGSTDAHRRRFLKTGVALGSIPVLRPQATQALAGGSTSLDCGFQVRSPWAYYALDSDGFDRGNEDLPPLSDPFDDLGQWTDNETWWTGNGYRFLEVPIAADRLGFESVAQPAGVAHLIGFECFRPYAPSNSEVMLYLGQNHGGDMRYGIELRIAADDRLYAYLRDDAATSLVLRTQQPIHAVSDGNLCVFLFVDDRPLGSRTAHLYVYLAGTDIHATRVRPKSIATLSPITGGPFSELKKLSIRAMRTPTDAAALQFNGLIRRLNIFNFGQTPPSDLGAIMDAMSRNHMAPVPEMKWI